MKWVVEQSFDKVIKEVLGTDAATNSQKYSCSSTHYLKLLQNVLQLSFSFLFFFLFIEN